MRFLRPESSVSCAYNEWGEEVFAGDRSGPVIHRKPEELGIPRVVADAPRSASNIVPPEIDPRKADARNRALAAKISCQIAERAGYSGKAANKGALPKGKLMNLQIGTPRE